MDSPAARTPTGIAALPLEMFRAMTESAADGIVTANATGNIAYLNPSAQRLFGLELNEAVGQPLTILMPVRFREQHLKGFQRYKTTGEAHVIGRTVELAGARRDGTEFPLELSLAAHGSGEGRFYIGIIRDITGRVRVAEQEAEIKRLKDIADFRARFLNVAAHELKTPLTPIRMQVQILQDRLKDADSGVAKSLRILGRAVDRLQTLMQDVLDAARAQADRLNLRKDTVSLSDVATEAVENYAAVAQEVGLTLDSSISPGVKVVGDSERLLQVTTNLLSNAVKFTAAGGRVRLTLRTEAEWAHLSVTDTGRGMTEDQLGRLFEPFAQVHPDLQATVKGTGLGLYITRAILQQHGGEITLTSAGPGQGTTALVRLPITQRAVAMSPVKSKASSIDQRLREMV